MNIDAVVEVVCTELARRGALVVRHGLTSRFQHLQRVEAMLEVWNEEPYIRLAGLLHRAYVGESGTRALYALTERPLLQALIGDQAELLVWCSGAPTDTPSEMHRDLAVIALAVAAEERCDANGCPIAWLAQASSALPRDAAVPAPLQLAPELPLAADEDMLLRAYAAASEMPFDANRIGALRDAAERFPAFAEPSLLLGSVALAEGDLAAAGRLGTHARSRVVAWNVAWDKRLPAEGWLALALFLEQASTAPPAEAAMLASVMHDALGSGFGPERLYIRLSAMDLLATAAAGPAADPSAEDEPFCDDDLNDVPSRFAEYLAGLLEDDPRRALAEYPGLRAQPWWDAEQFPLVQALEGAAGEIAREFAALDPRTFHAESERIEREGNWDVFLLYERGRKREERCALVPVTTAIIEAHATLRTQAGLVYFSRLAPGSIVAPHRGPTNVRLRCHLGLAVPDDCGISVDNVVKTWHEGKCIVFDDSFTHSVWNSSDRERVVLIVDFWHPDLDPEEGELLAGLHRYGATMAEGLTAYWRKNDEALVAAW